ncbi:MAG: hypothetical protein M1829_002082 [Trizodia sp. TS-e1964]|nr:MAG: hypothetical protein M1829_002082 [Trizodia sp. TS-e1964]
MYLQSFSQLLTLFLAWKIQAVPIPVNFEDHFSNCKDPFRLDNALDAASRLFEVEQEFDQFGHECPHQGSSDPTRHAAGIFGVGALGGLGLSAAYNNLIIPNIPGPVRDGVRMPRFLTASKYAKLTEEQAARLTYNDVFETIDVEAAKRITPQAIKSMKFKALAAIPDDAAGALSPDALGAVETELMRHGSDLRYQAMDLAPQMRGVLGNWLRQILERAAVSIE